MTSNKYICRFATKEDVDEFYLPEDQKYSMKAWVLEKDGKIYAIGGLWLVNNSWTAFVKVRDSLPAKAFWKASMLVTAELKKLQLPIVAIKDEALESSERYLTKLGYEFFDIQNNKRIFKLWHKQQ